MYQACSFSSFCFRFDFEIYCWKSFDIFKSTSFDVHSCVSVLVYVSQCIFYVQILSSTESHERAFWVGTRMNEYILQILLITNIRLALNDYKSLHECKYTIKWTNNSTNLKCYNTSERLNEFGKYFVTMKYSICLEGLTIFIGWFIWR